VFDRHGSVMVARCPQTWQPAIDFDAIFASLAAPERAKALTAGLERLAVEWEEYR